MKSFKHICSHLTVISFLKNWSLKIHTRPDWCVLQSVLGRAVWLVTCTNYCFQSCDSSYNCDHYNSKMSFMPRFVLKSSVHRFLLLIAFIEAHWQSIHSRDSISFIIYKSGRFHKIITLKKYLFRIRRKCTYLRMLILSFIFYIPEIVEAMIKKNLQVLRRHQWKRNL